MPYSARGARFDDNSPQLQNSSKHADHSYDEQLLKNKGASPHIGSSTSSVDDILSKSSKSAKTNEQDPKYKALEALQTIQNYIDNQEGTDHRDLGNMEKEKEIQRLKDEIVAHEVQSKIRDKELNKIEHKYAEAKSEIKSLRLTYQEMTENVESEEMKRDQVLAKYKTEREDLEKQNIRMTAHIKTLETSLAQLNSEMTTVDKETARSERDDQRVKNTRISTEMKQLEKSLAQKDSDIKLLYDVNGKKEAAYQKVMDDFQKAILEIQRLKTERDDLYHVIDEYKAKESRHAQQKGEKKPRQSATDSGNTGISKMNRSRR